MQIKFKMQKEKTNFWVCWEWEPWTEPPLGVSAERAGSESHQEGQLWGCLLRGAWQLVGVSLEERAELRGGQESPPTCLTSICTIPAIQIVQELKQVGN